MENSTPIPSYASFKGDDLICSLRVSASQLCFFSKRLETQMKPLLGEMQTKHLRSLYWPACAENLHTQCTLGQNPSVNMRFWLIIQFLEVCACSSCTQGDNLSEPEKSISFASHSREERKIPPAACSRQTGWNTGAGLSGGSHDVAFLSACCVGNSRVSKWACYWQLSPSPWAGGAVCCVGRGYTCSGPARPRCRCTSHLRPVPSCRSASPPLGWGTEPAESEKITDIFSRTSTETGCLCPLLFIAVATQQNLLKLQWQTRQNTVTLCIQTFLD